MDSSLLVDIDVASGEKLIGALASLRIYPDAAIWMRMGDMGEWRLVLGLSLVDKQGPRVTYERVQHLLKKNRSEVRLTLSEISVVSVRDPLFDRMRDAVRWTANVKDVWIPGLGVHDLYIGNVYVYSLYPTCLDSDPFLEEATGRLGGRIGVIRHVERGEDVFLVGGPADVSMEPNDWRWCGYSRPTRSNRTKANAVLERMKQEKAAVVGLGAKEGQQQIRDSDGKLYLISSDQLGPYTLAVATEMPPGASNHQQSLHALEILARLAGRAEEADQAAELFGVSS